MKSVDLHPEDLLERDARGELTPDEKARLLAHLALCDVCRFEQLARADVERELGRAEAVDVQRLLASVLTPESLRASRRPSARPGATRRLASRAALLAAALITIAGVSAAAGWPRIRATFSHHDRTVDTLAEAPSAPALARRTPTPIVPRPVVTETPVSVEAPVAPIVPVVTPPTLVQTSVARPVLPPAAPPVDPVPAPATAATLFEEATRARRAGDGTAAAIGYQKLIAAYPSSAEAHQALAALGRMQLDRGDAAGALGDFDQYLRAGGPLREDVMADRAVALRRLGRSGDEAVAWSSLLAAYPSSVHAERARRRLTELGVR